MKSELAKKMIAAIFAAVMVLSAFVMVAGAGDSSGQTIAVDAKDGIWELPINSSPGHYLKNH